MPVLVARASQPGASQYWARPRTHALATHVCEHRTQQNVPEPRSSVFGTASSRSTTAPLPTPVLALSPEASALVLTMPRSALQSLHDATGLLAGTFFQNKP